MHPTGQFPPVQKSHGPGRQREGTEPRTATAFLLTCSEASSQLRASSWDSEKRGNPRHNPSSRSMVRPVRATALGQGGSFQGAEGAAAAERHTRSIQPRLHQSPARQGPRPLRALQACLSPSPATPLPRPRLLALSEPPPPVPPRCSPSDPCLQILPPLGSTIVRRPASCRHHLQVPPPALE